MEGNFAFGFYWSTSYIWEADSIMCFISLILCNLSFHMVMEEQTSYALTWQLLFETKSEDCLWSWSISQVSKEAWETKVYNLNIYFCQPPYNHQTHKNWSKIWEFTTKLNLSSIFISIGSGWGMWVNVVIRWMINNLLVLLRKSVTPTIFQIKI